MSSDQERKRIQELEEINSLLRFKNESLQKRLGDFSSVFQDVYQCIILPKDLADVHIPGCPRGLTNWLRSNNVLPPDESFTDTHSPSSSLAQIKENSKSGARVSARSSSPQNENTDWEVQKGRRRKKSTQNSPALPPSHTRTTEADSQKPSPRRERTVSWATLSSLSPKASPFVSSSPLPRMSPLAKPFTPTLLPQPLEASVLSQNPISPATKLDKTPAGKEKQSKQKKKKSKKSKGQAGVTPCKFLMGPTGICLKGVQCLFLHPDHLPLPEDPEPERGRRTKGLVHAGPKPGSPPRLDALSMLRSARQAPAVLADDLKLLAGEENTAKREQFLKHKKEQALALELGEKVDEAIAAYSHVLMFESDNETCLFRRGMLLRQKASFLATSRFPSLQQQAASLHNRSVQDFNKARKHTTSVWIRLAVLLCQAEAFMIRGMTELALADANEGVALQEAIINSSSDAGNIEDSAQKDLLEKSGLRAYALRSQIYDELGLEQEAIKDRKMDQERTKNESLTSSYLSLKALMKAMAQQKTPADLGIEEKLPQRNTNKSPPERKRSRRESSSGRRNSSALKPTSNDASPQSSKSTTQSKKNSPPGTNRRKHSGAASSSTAKPSSRVRAEKEIIVDSGGNSSSVGADAKKEKQAVLAVAAIPVPDEAGGEECKTSGGSEIEASKQVEAARRAPLMSYASAIDGKPRDLKKTSSPLTATDPEEGDSAPSKPESEKKRIRNRNRNKKGKKKKEDASVKEEEKKKASSLSQATDEFVVYTRKKERPKQNKNNATKRFSKEASLKPRKQPNTGKAGKQANTRRPQVTAAPALGSKSS